MRDHNCMSRFDRAAGKVAGGIFWTVIGGISLALKLYYATRPKSYNAKDTDTVDLSCRSGESSLEMEQSTRA
jgi:hypothetical protein